MRLATFRDSDGVGLGVAQGDRLLDLRRAGEARSQPTERASFDTMLALIGGGSSALDAVRSLVAGAEESAWAPLDQVMLLAPISRPPKNVLCVGRNYAEHAAESLRAAGRPVQLPPAPNIFTKAATAINGPTGDIPYDTRVSERLDWEVELGVVIGVGGRHIRREDALAHVFGYTVINDISARDVQNRPGMQWFLGKSMDGSCPMGPVILTADELPDPQRLTLRLSVNGVMKQEDTTANMLFTVAAIIEELSRVLTLEPGDVIATGTPAGVGFARTPPEFLRPDDLVEASIEGIGALRNRVVAVSS